MKKILNLTFIGLVAACGSETEEEKTIDILNVYSKDLVESCLDSKHKDLCSSKVVTVKLLDTYEEKTQNSLCFTQNDPGSSFDKEKLFLAISNSYLKMGNRKELIYRNIFECLTWRVNDKNLSFSEFAFDLNLQAEDQ